MTIPQLPAEAEAEYYKKLAMIESGNNPKAKASTSSASGLYQPIKSTWERYGYNWKDVFDVKLQNEFVERFTRDNANILIKAGCAINFATLYGAHFLGPSGFLKVMRGVPSASISTVTSANQRKANPSILTGTIRDFTDWLKRKTGDEYTKRYTGGATPTPQPKPAPIPVEPAYPTPPKKSRAWVYFVGLLIAVAIVVYFVFIRRG